MAMTPSAQSLSTASKDDIFCGVPMFGALAENEILAAVLCEARRVR